MSRRTADRDRVPATRRATVIGVEIDGSRVTAVQVAGTRAIASRVVTADSATDALHQALRGTPAGARVAVMVAGEAQVSARLSVTAPPSNREELITAVAAHVRNTRGADRAIVDDNVSIAASFRAPTGVGLRWSGLAVAAPTQRVRTVCDTAREHTTGTVELLPTPVADAHAATLVLALRETNSTATLSYDGVPVATAQFHAGGLGVVEAALGSGDSVGHQRTSDALTYGGVRDPLAALELDRWLGEVLDELTAAIAGWREDGLAVPDQVFLYGRAARAASLDLLLDDYGLRRAQTPPAMASGLLDIAEADRSHVVGAYLAALADLTPTGPLGDLAAFADPSRVAADLRRTRARHRRRLTSAVLATTAALALAATGPHLLALGAARIDRAHALDLTTSAATSLGVSTQDVTTAASALAARNAAAPTLDAAVAGDVASLTPPAAVLTDLLIEPSGSRTTVNVTADLGTTVTLPELLEPWRAAGFTITSVTTHAPTTVTVGMLR